MNIYYKKLYRLLFCIILIPCASAGQKSERIEIKLNYSATGNSTKSLIPYKKLRRPRIGLALSGGGARCIYQIGVLQVFEEHNIPVDYIVGTSMGSVIGGFYAAGYSLDKILYMLNKINWNQIIVDTPPRSTLFLGQKQDRERYLLQLRFSSFKPYIPPGLTPGQTITNILTDFTMRAPCSSITDFTKLMIPFRVVATDLISGKKVLLESGNLAEAMCASLAFPLLFTPVRWDSMLLVDGGLTNNIPVSETQDFGADIVIAVDATANLRSEQNILLPWQVVDQASGIMQREKNQQQRELADILLRLENNERLSSDFTELTTLIEIGRKIAFDRLDDIKRLIYEKSLCLIKYDSTSAESQFFVDSFQIKGLNTLSADFFNSILLPIKFSRTSLHSLLLKLIELYSTGYFQDVTGEIIKNDYAASLIITVVENPVLRNIIIEGNSVFADSVLLSKFSNKPGQVINYKSGQKDLQRLIQPYRDNGYALAEIRDISQDTLNNIRIRVDEGKIDKIILDGNKHTHDFVIIREFPLKQGDIFNYDTAKIGIKNIYGTGLFNTVRLNMIGGHKVRKIVIKLNEKNFGLIRIGGRYNRERQGRAFVEFVNENMLGSSHKFAFHAQYGEKDELFKAQFRADRIFKTYFTYNFKFFYSKNRYNCYSFDQKTGQYAISRTGLNLSVGQQMRRLGTLSVEGKINHIKYRSLSGYGYPVDELDLKILRIASIVDTQNQFPYPKKGKYHRFYYEVSSAQILTSEESYFKLFSSLETYSTYFSYHTLHPKLVWGTSDLTTPYSEQYRLGGVDNFYGLRDQQMVGRHIMSASLEYRLKIPKKTAFDSYLHIIGGIGGIWSKEADINAKDFMYSIGLKMSAMTPLGPAAFAYGRVNDGRSRFYFSIGYVF